MHSPLVSYLFVCRSNSLLYSPLVSYLLSAEVTSCCKYSLVSYLLSAEVTPCCIALAFLLISRPPMYKGPDRSRNFFPEEEIGKTDSCWSTATLRREGVNCATTECHEPSLAAMELRRQARTKVGAQFSNLQSMAKNLLLPIVFIEQSSVNSYRILQLWLMRLIVFCCSIQVLLVWHVQLISHPIKGSFHHPSLTDGWPGLYFWLHKTGC